MNDLHRFAARHHRPRRYPMDKALPESVRIARIDTGEPGYIIQPVLYDRARGEWTHYKVLCGAGLRVWRRDEFDLRGPGPAAPSDTRREQPGPEPAPGPPRRTPTTTFPDAPITTLTNAAAAAKGLLALRYRPTVVRDEEAAFAIADRCRGYVMLGEGAFWVVCLADAARLEGAGYQFAPRPAKT